MKINFNGARFTERCLIRKVCAYALKKLGQPDKVEFAGPHLDEEKMLGLNASSRGVDCVTDVLSFPTLDGDRKPLKIAEHKEDVNPENGNLLLGELYLCRAVVKKQAAEYGHSMRRESAFLVLHGLLHLLGYDHLQPEDEQQMTALQREILNELKITREGK